jgi:hypothetical protein
MPISRAIAPDGWKVYSSRINRRAFYQQVLSNLGRCEQDTGIGSELHLAYRSVLLGPGVELEPCVSCGEIWDGAENWDSWRAVNLS